MTFFPPVVIGRVLRRRFVGVICQMPDLSSHLHTIGHVRNPWPPFIRPHIFHSRGQWLGTEAKRSFLSLNKRPLSQIVLPRLISFGLFFLAPHEGICGRGQTFHLIKATFHISSPLSPVISLSSRLSYLLCLFPFLSSIIRSPKVPFAVTVPFWLALDAFWNRRLTRALMLLSNRH